MEHQLQRFLSDKIWSKPIFSVYRWWWWWWCKIFIWCCIRFTCLTWAHLTGTESRLRFIFYFLFMLSQNYCRNFIIFYCKSSLRFFRGRSEVLHRLLNFYSRSVGNPRNIDLKCAFFIFAIQFLLFFSKVVFWYALVHTTNAQDHS